MVHAPRASMGLLVMLGAATLTNSPMTIRLLDSLGCECEPLRQCWMHLYEYGSRPELTGCSSCWDGLGTFASLLASVARWYHLHFFACLRMPNDFRVTGHLQAEGVFRATGYFPAQRKNFVSLV
eukprot:6202869-Pleurochrysis_carterae.AAC.2